MLGFKKREKPNSAIGVCSNTPSASTQTLNSRQAPQQLRAPNLDYSELEPRIAFDAAFAASLIDVATDNPDAEFTSDSDQSHTDDPADRTSAIDLFAIDALGEGSPTSEIVFIDADIEDIDTLLASINPNAEIILLDPNRDGVEQIAEAMSQRSNVSAIHILAHGSSGQLALGTGLLTTDSMSNIYAGQLANIALSLSADADILIYGCDFASGDIGLEAITALAGLTGADIAASDDATGTEQLGGDWILEKQIGEIETTLAINKLTAQSWDHILASITFREGDTGYTGTQDTFISNLSPSTDHGTLNYISIDDGAPLEAGLLQFNNMFGNAPGQIPYGSTVSSATLSLYVLNRDLLDQVYLYEMAVSWNESSTHDSLGSGITVGIDTYSTRLATIDAGILNAVNVTGLGSVVQGWANGDPNRGLAFIANYTDSWEFASSEHGTAAFRPYLTINYTTASPIAPTVTTSGGIVTYVEDTSPLAIDANLTVTDADSTDLQGATIRITNFVSGQDSLNFSNQNGISGSWDSSTGTLTLSGASSVANYQLALRSVTYENTSDSPDVTTRTFEITANDGGLNSAAEDFSINITAVNDAPSGIDGTITVTENTEYTFNLSDFTFIDIEGHAIARLWIDTLPASGTLRFNGSSFAAGNWIDANDITLGLFTYLPVAEVDGTGVASFTFQVEDNGGTANGGVSLDQSPNTITIDITAVDSPPSGTPTITGTPTEDQTLTADTSGISDADGLGAFTYQWYRDTGSGPVAISGATASTYNLDDIDVGAAISVAVSYIDGEGNTEGPLNSTPTVAVANVNDDPTGLPSVTGTPTQGETLTADPSALADDDGLGPFSYYWLRDGVLISGATSINYVLTQSDVGSRISVLVTYTDGHGTAEGLLVSPETAPIANVNDVPAGVPVITGTPTEDQILTADISGISDADGLGTFTYQWYRDTGSGPVAITGANASSYILGDNDVGAAISLAVTYTDGGGTVENLTSAQTAPIANVNDVPAGVPVITGTPTEDQILTADISGISDADGLGAFTYQWYRDTGSGPVAITGANASSYILGDNDVGAAISVAVSYVDAHGTSEGPLTSTAVSPIANVNDAPVIISGNGGPTASFSVEENSAYVATMASTDIDGGVPSYSINGGADASLFRIDTATGVIRFNVQPNFESPGDSDGDGIYEILVQVDDGNGGTDQQQIIVIVTDVLGERVNEQPITGIPIPPNVPPITEEIKPVIRINNPIIEAPLVSEVTPLHTVPITSKETIAKTGEDEPETVPNSVLVEVNNSFNDIFGLTKYEIGDFTSPAFDIAEKNDFGDEISLNLHELNEPALWQSFDKVATDIREQELVLGLEMGQLTLGGGVALTSGVVAWVLRGGALASSLLAAIPTLHSFDPILVVLARRGTGNDSEVDADPVESLFTNKTQSSARGHK